MRARRRALIAIVAVTAMLLLGTVAVFAGEWHWNAEIDVEAVDPEGALNYSAKIRVDLPKDANATLVAEADTEEVKLKHHGNLSCQSDGLTADVTYRVTGNDGAVGTLVTVTVTADGEVVASATGSPGENIRLNSILIPGAICSGG